MNLNKLKKTFIVAEIGNNHEGTFNVACKLIEEAKLEIVSLVVKSTEKLLESHPDHDFDNKAINIIKKM